jgi:hypothetical protein
MNIATELGPLPESDENARLQRESFKALDRLLSGQNTFVFRHEPIEDFGVDGSLELNIDGHMTNFRAQVQMKSSAHLKATADGYIARQVESANLNHLLNGTCPLYLLWDESTDAFWYLWAQDENRRLSTDNSSWREQKTITLKFREKFTANSFSVLQKRILDSGRLLRKIHDSLARATDGEQVFFRIDVDSLSITDPSMATSVLLASGTAIVAAGFPKQVVELMRLVDPATCSLPRMELTRGYAEYTLGNHWEAISHIRHAMARGDELSSQDNQFLVSLKDASEYHVGLIDSATYESRTRDRIKTLTGVEALHAKQDALYHQCVRSTNLQERSKLAKELRSVTEKISNDAKAMPSSKLNAKLLLLYVEGIEANFAASQKEFTAEIRSKLYPEDVLGILGSLQEARERRQQWGNQATEALREAYDLNHPILIFQALYVSLKIMIGRLFEECLDEISHNRNFVIKPSQETRFQQMLDEAARLNVVNGSVEGRLQLDELKAEFLELQGDLEAAKATALTMHPIASAMGFGPTAQTAKDLIDGDTLLARFKRKYSEDAAADKDVELASNSDEQLARLAGHFYGTLETPVARYEVVLEHLRIIRQMAQERVNCCRYLVMLEDLSKSTIKETAFSELPSRKCQCTKFGYTTVHESLNATSVIVEFKQSYCGTCLDRSPKRD